MPHSTTMDSSSARATSLNRQSGLRQYGEANGELNGGTEKFPEFDNTTGTGFANGRSASPRRHKTSFSVSSTSDRWQPRRDSRVRWAPADQQPAAGHGRQRGLSNAIRQFRSGSMSHNAQEIAGALRAPVSYRLIVRLSNTLVPFNNHVQERGTDSSHPVGTLYDVVLVVRAHQHIVEIDLDCIRQTCHLDTHSVCICVNVLHPVLLARV